MIGSRRPRSQQPPGAAIQQLSGCGGIAFGLFFAVFSLVFMVSAASTAWNDWWQTRNWQQVEAQLDSCEVTFSPEPRAEADAEGDGRAFQLKVSYRYEYGGRSFTSNRWHKEAAGSDLYEPFGKAEARLKSARPLYCLINPDRPDEAILERRSEGWPMVVWGLPFFLVGVGLIVIGRKASKVTDATTTMEEASPLGSLLLGGAFFSIFLAAGLFVCWQGINALIAGNRAKTWPKTPCEIVRTGWNNDVRQVLYRYTVNGEAYHSDRVRPAGRMTFIGGSPHWEFGARTTCRVDPSDPRSAVLQTESRGWLAILIGVPFLAVGLFGAGAVIYKRQKARLKKAPQIVDALWLSSRAARGKAVGILAFFNLFWNGIVGVFVTLAANGGWGGGFLIWLFLTPFIFIGLVMAVTLFGHLLTMALPSARVMIEPMPPVAGAETVLSWEIAPSRLFHPREVTLRLQAEWRDSGHRDPSLRTQKPWCAVLWSGTVPRGSLASGTEKIRLPDPRKELSALAPGALRWSLVLHATIPGWVDLNEEWPVEFEVPKAEPPVSPVAD